MRRAIIFAAVLLGACSADFHRCSGSFPHRPYFFLGECVSAASVAGTVIGTALALGVSVWLISVVVGIRNAARRAAEAAEDSRRLLAEVRAILDRDD